MLVRERRSIRRFSQQPVDREIVAGLLADCLWAPSPHNAQPWRFTALFSNETKTALAEAMGNRLVQDLSSEGASQGVVSRQVSRSRERILSAPVAVLCSLVDDGLVISDREQKDFLEREMAVQSVGAVLQTLFLLAADQGLGACWMAAPMYCPDAVVDILELPSTYRPQALVLLGYPADGGKVRPRRLTAEMIELR
jgi:coenzyme F420-0:L-glutamate ligase / coenzyme F420-1:gamma-L-glutamate ligase